MPSPITLLGCMTADDKQFFKSLGTRIAQLRKEQGLSQQALADELGLPQQTLAHYEVGRARMPVSLLPILAHQFAVPVDELLGMRNGKGAGKRGPTPKLQRQVEQISRLPRPKQRFVMEMLDTVLQQTG